MNTHQIDDRLRSWIASRDPGPAPLTLRVSTARVAHDERRAADLPLIGAQLIGRASRFAIAAAAAVLVAIGGIGMVAFVDLGRPATSPQPTPAVSPVITSEPVLPRLGKIAPGRYQTSVGSAEVHLTVPAGWSGNGMGVSRASASSRGPLDLIITPSDVSYVVSDMCSDEADVTLAPVGPGVEGLTTALANQRGVMRSGPTDVTLGGSRAKKFVLTLLPSCPGASGHGFWADATGTYGLWLRPGDTATVYVVDVGGDPLLITYQFGAGASVEDIAQLEAISASIAIEPIPGARPSPRASRGGWLAVGRHSIDVDGVPISFSVPALKPDVGWNLYGSTEISKDTGGSQHAEAMVYWTAFPEGGQTHQCTELDLPVGASIVDLAEAVSTAPGTSLVSGPTEVTVGGLSAQHVVLTVRDDLGCDPKYFFSSEPPGGGPGWWTTSVADTIRVWIVDVDGTRLFIAGESKPTASPELEQEIEDIVASIRFE